MKDNRYFRTGDKGWIISFLIFAIALLLPGIPQGLSKAAEADKILSYAGWSEISPSKNHFLLVGDTQKTSHWEFWRERNDKERTLIIAEITRRDPAFVLHLGDLTTRGSSRKHWQDFDNLNRGMREKRIPYFPTLGNHEFYGDDEAAFHHYFGRFPHLEHRRWYSFTWNRIGILMVDSNFSKLTNEQIDEQSKWYLKELEKFENDERIDLVIAGCHEPPFTNSQVIRPNPKSKAYFADPFIRFRKASLFFSGHCHSYERFQVGGKFFVVSGGGGGPRHKLSIDPTKRKYPDLYPGPELRFFHFCELEKQNRSVSFRVIRLDENGTFTTVDPLTISK